MLGEDEEFRSDVLLGALGGFRCSLVTSGGSPSDFGVEGMSKEPTRHVNED